MRVFQPIGSDELAAARMGREVLVILRLLLEEVIKAQGGESPSYICVTIENSRFD